MIVTTFNGFQFLFGVCLIEKAIIDDQHRTYDRNHERHFLDIYFKKIEDSKQESNATHSCKYNAYK